MVNTISVPVEPEDSVSVETLKLQVQITVSIANHLQAAAPQSKQ